jgi:hypothetical protein
MPRHVLVAQLWRESARRNNCAARTGTCSVCCSIPALPAAATAAATDGCALLAEDCSSKREAGGMTGERGGVERTCSSSKRAPSSRVKTGFTFRKWIRDCWMHRSRVYLWDFDQQVLEMGERSLALADGETCRARAAWRRSPAAR